MSTLIRSEAVTFYAAQVRARLAGLDPEVLDDLTDGLEADLTESLLDSLQGTEDPVAEINALDADALVARFGLPSAYATELAIAAAVSVPESVVARPSRRSLGEVLTDAREGVAADVRGLADRRPWVREGLAMAGALRPVWWVLRAWGVFVVIAAVLGLTLVPNGLLSWAILVLLVIASVQWGRGRYGQGAWGRRLWLTVGWGAGLAALIGFSNVAVGQSWSTATASPSAWDDGYSAGLMDADPWLQGSSGVFIDGTPVANLFVFGPDGVPIAGAQIVDQDGRPLVLSSSEPGLGTWVDWLESGYGYTDSYADGELPAAILTEAGQLNVYPYAWVRAAQVRWDDAGRPYAAPGALEIAPTWPAGTLLPIEGFDAAASEDAAIAPDADSDAGADPDANAGADPDADPDATGSSSTSSADQPAEEQPADGS